MKQKTSRLSTIQRLISQFRISSQEELMIKLEEEGYRVTQATLSRDLKQLRAIKVPNDDGQYVFVIESYPGSTGIRQRTESKSPFQVQTSIEFSGQLAVLKTKPGHAGAIASEIDAQAPNVILGTIAGDDTVLLIPREGIERKDILKALTGFIRID